MIDKFDDKMAVILAVVIITCWSMQVLGVDSKEIVMSAMTGLMGIAVGRGLK